MDEALAYVDTMILRLMDGLYRQHLHMCVNVIILSDHGKQSFVYHKRFKNIMYEYALLQFLKLTIKQQNGVCFEHTVA